jgi:hypothetical protein
MLGADVEGWMFSLVLVSGLSFAAPVSVDSDPGHVDAMPFGHDALWDAYLRFYEPDQLPADDLPEPMCATTLVNALKFQWGEFSPVERARITQHVAPGLTDLNGPPIGGYPPRHEEFDPPGFGMPAPKHVCQEIYPYDNHLDGDHFSVEWNNDTPGFSLGTAQDFLDKLEYDYTTEIDELGWQMPAGMDRYLLPVYVEKSPYAAAAYTTVDYYNGGCGGVYPPYIVAE